MTGLDKIRETVCACLLENGVDAVTAWGKEERKRHTDPVAAVSLRGCEGTRAGFGDYLGERYNSDAKRWEEVYGKRARFTFGLDLYAQSRDGAERCQSAFDKIADALQAADPEGLKLESLSRGEMVFDETLGVFHCPVTAVCGAYLYAVADEEGEFADFEVRGEKKQ